MGGSSVARSDSGVGTEANHVPCLPSSGAHRPSKRPHALVCADSPGAKVGGLEMGDTCSVKRRRTVTSANAAGFAETAGGCVTEVPMDAPPAAVAVDCFQTRSAIATTPAEPADGMIPARTARYRVFGKGSEERLFKRRTRPSLGPHRAAGWHCSLYVTLSCASYCD